MYRIKDLGDKRDLVGKLCMYPTKISNQYFQIGFCSRVNKKDIVFDGLDHIDIQRENTIAIFEEEDINELFKTRAFCSELSKGISEDRESVFHKLDNLLKELNEISELANHPSVNVDFSYFQKEINELTDKVREIKNSFSSKDILPDSEISETWESQMTIKIKE